MRFGPGLLPVQSAQLSHVRDYSGRFRLGSRSWKPLIRWVLLGVQGDTKLKPKVETTGYPGGCSYYKGSDALPFMMTQSM